MKNAKFIFMLLIIPFLLGVHSDEGKSNNTSNAPDKKVVAQVIKIIKDVTKKTADETDWEAAKKGDPLEDGGEVKTGSKSVAVVVFADGSGTLRVRENSILHIYGTDKGKTMDKNTFIQKGLIGFDVRKQSADEEFKFTTPTVVASIRGTNGFLEYGEDSTFTMYLESGSAGLQGSGTCDSLAAGSTIVVSPDGRCLTRNQTEQDVKKFNSVNKTTTKKINIKTKTGDVQIEFLEP